MNGFTTPRFYSVTVEPYPIKVDNFLFDFCEEAPVPLSESLDDFNSTLKLSIRCHFPVAVWPVVVERLPLWQALPDEQGRSRKKHQHRRPPSTLAEHSLDRMISLRR